MSAEEIKFDCPECGEGLAIDRRAIGHQVACPFCKAPITVPDVAEKAIEEKATKKAVLPPKSGAPSLEELASSRPEVAESDPAEASSPSQSTASANGGEGEGKKVGLPPKRKPGELPRAMAESPAPAAGRVAMPPGRPGPPPAPSSGTRQGAPTTDAPAASDRAKPAAQAPTGKSNANGESSSPPPGYEEKVRRKRKRRNPDEHRLNPREHPKMVTFDEVIGDNTFRDHPARSKMPFWKKLGVLGVLLGIAAAVALGVLKQMQLNEPDASTQPKVLTGMEKEYEAARDRLDRFRDATSVADKMSYVRIPVTTMESYPPLADRMAEFYERNTLNAHFPSLTRSSATAIQQGDTEFLRITMQNKGIESYIYFEKTAGGYALDWDSFVGYNPKGWTEFLVDPAGESESGVFRLIFERKDHYTGIYQDQNKYRSYLVTDIAANLSAIAYVVRGTPAEEAIEAEFAKLRLRDDQRVLMIAEVNLVERGLDGTNLTYIEKILRSNWLLP